MKTDPLDLILVEQLIAARNNLKTLKRLRKLINDEEHLDYLETAIYNRIEFFENHIENKKLLRKKNRISITRTLTKVVYAVRFIYYFRHMFRRGNK